MKILEFTDERLTIVNEPDVIEHIELTNIAIVVNLLVNTFFILMWASSNSFIQVDWQIKSFNLCLAINFIVVIFYFKNTRIDFTWYLLITAYALPGIGVILLLSNVACPRQIARVIFDKNKNIVIEKKLKFLFWNRSCQYALNEILEVNLVKTGVCTGSNYIEVDTVQIARRQDGKTYFFSLFSGKDASSIVQAINAFLLPLR